MLNHSRSSSAAVSVDVFCDATNRTRISARTSSFNLSSSYFNSCYVFLRMIMTAALLGCMYLIFPCATRLNHHVFPLGALTAARAEESLNAENLPSRGGRGKKSRSEKVQRKAGEELSNYRNPALFWWTPDWVPDPEVDFAYVWSPWTSPWWPSLSGGGSKSADHVPNASDPLGGVVRGFASEPIITQRFSLLLDQAVSRLVRTTSDVIHRELKTRERSSTTKSTPAEAPSAPPPIGVSEPQKQIINNDAYNSVNADEEGSSGRKAGHHVIESERKERKTTPANNKKKNEEVVQENHQEPAIPIPPSANRHPQLHPIREAFNALFPTYVPPLGARVGPNESSLFLTPVDRAHWVLDVKKTVQERLDDLLLFANATKKGNSKPKTAGGEAPDNSSEKGSKLGGGGGAAPSQPVPIAVPNVTVVNGKARALSKAFPLQMGTRTLAYSRGKRSRKDDKVLEEDKGEGKAAIRRRGGEKPISSADTAIDTIIPLIGIGGLWSSVIPTRLAIPYFGSFQPAADSSSSTMQQKGNDENNSSNTRAETNNSSYNDHTLTTETKNENKIDLSTHGIHASDSIASFNSPFRNDMLMHYLHYSPATLEISSYTQLANIISAFSRDGGRGGGRGTKHDAQNKEEENDDDEEERESNEHIAATEPYEDEVTNAIVTVIIIPRGVSNATVTLLKELAISHRRNYHQHAQVRDLNRGGSVGYGLGGGSAETQRLLFILREDMMPDVRPLQWSVLDLSSSLSSRPTTPTTTKTASPYILPKRNQRVTVLDGEEAFQKMANEARYVQGDAKEGRPIRSERRKENVDVLGEDANNQVRRQQKATLSVAKAAQQGAISDLLVDKKDRGSQHTPPKEQPSAQTSNSRRDGPPIVSLWEFEVVRKAPPSASVSPVRKATSLRSDEGTLEKRSRPKKRKKKVKSGMVTGEEGSTKKTTQRGNVKEGETFDPRAPRISVTTTRRASPTSAAAREVLDITNARVLTLPMTTKQQQVPTRKKDTTRHKAAGDERTSNIKTETAEGDVLEAEEPPAVIAVDLTISPVVFHTMLHRLADYGSATQLLTRLTPQNFQRYYLWPSTSPTIIHHPSAVLSRRKIKAVASGGRGRPKEGAQRAGDGRDEGVAGARSHDTLTDGATRARKVNSKETYLFGGDGDAREHSMRVGKTRRLCRNALREYVNKNKEEEEEEERTDALREREKQKMSPQDEVQQGGAPKKGVDLHNNDEASSVVLRLRELSRLCFNGTIFAVVADDNGGKCQSAMRAVARWHRLAEKEEQEHTQCKTGTRDRNENENENGEENSRGRRRHSSVLLGDDDDDDEINGQEEILAVSGGHLMFSTISLQTHDDKRFYRSLVRGATGMRGEKREKRAVEGFDYSSSYRLVERSLWRLFEDASPIPLPLPSSSSSSFSPHSSPTGTLSLRKRGGCRVLMIAPLMGTLKPLWYASPESLVTEGSRTMRGVGPRQQPKSMMTMGSPALFSFPLFDLLDRDNVAVALSTILRSEERVRCGMFPLMLEGSSSSSLLLPPSQLVSPNTRSAGVAPTERVKEKIDDGEMGTEGKQAAVALLLKSKRDEASPSDSNANANDGAGPSIIHSYYEDDTAGASLKNAGEPPSSSWWAYKEAVARLKQEALREEAREKAALKREAAASMALTPTSGLIGEKGPSPPLLLHPVSLPYHNLLAHPSSTMMLRAPLRMAGNRFYGVECAAALHVVVSPTSGCGALCQRISLVLIPQLADAMPWLRIHIYDRLFLLSEADGGSRGGGGRDRDRDGGVLRRGPGRSTRRGDSSSLPNSRRQRKQSTRTSTLRQKKLAEGARFVEPSKCTPVPIYNDDTNRAEQCRDHIDAGNTYGNTLNKCDNSQGKWVDSTPLLPPFATSSSCTTTTHRKFDACPHTDPDDSSQSSRALQLPPLPYHPLGKTSPLRKSSSSPQKVLEDVMMRSMMLYLIGKVTARKTEEGGRIMVPALYLQIRNLTSSSLLFSRSSPSSSEYERFDDEKRSPASTSSSYSNAANADHDGFTRSSGNRGGGYKVDDNFINNKADSLFLYHNKDFADVRSFITFISEAMVAAECPMPL